MLAYITYKIHKSTVFLITKKVMNESSLSTPLSPRDDDDDRDPEEVIEELRDEVSKKDVTLRETRDKLLQQQAYFLDALKQCETVIRQLANEHKSSTDLRTSSGSQRDLHSTSPSSFKSPQIKEEKTHTDKVIQQISASRSPTGASKSKTIHVTLEESITYPPGYNPNKRRGSVSAESPGTCLSNY
jgi:hypothetical protein